MKITFNLDEKSAREEYKNASLAIKSLMEKSAPDGFFEVKSKSNRVDSIESALLISPPNEDMKSLLNYNGDNCFMVKARTYLQLLIIAEAIREGWIPDFDNENQKKWYPYFIKSGSGWAFRATRYDYTFTNATVGSRLCFPTQELAEYFGRQFIALHKIILQHY